MSPEPGAEAEDSAAASGRRRTDFDFVGLAFAASGLAWATAGIR